MPRFTGPRAWRLPSDCACGDHSFADTSAWGVVLVSAEDRHFLENYVWTLSPVSWRNVYAYSDRFGRERNGSTFLHHAVLPPVDGTVNDHENGNTLDNRRKNLRRLSFKDNIRNSCLSRNSVTGFKGVGPDPDRPGYFRARIMVNRKDFYLGSFQAPEEAAHAYDHAARKYFGAAARLNFPETDHV